DDHHRIVARAQIHDAGFPNARDQRLAFAAAQRELIRAGTERDRAAELDLSAHRERVAAVAEAQAAVRDGIYDRDGVRAVAECDRHLLSLDAAGDIPVDRYRVVAVAKRQ